MIGKRFYLNLCRRVAPPDVSHRNKVGEKLIQRVGRRQRTQRARGSVVPFNWIILGSVLLLGFLLRIVAIITLVAYQDCDAIIYLTNGVDDGLGYSAAIAVCAGLLGILQLLVARAGWIESTWRWSDAALGLVNLFAVCVILVQGLLYFGFSNPETRSGFTINRLSTHLDHSQFYPPEPMEFGTPDPAYGWKAVSNNEWRNERGNIVVKEEVVKTCFTKEFARAHFKARNPGQTYEEPVWLIQYGRVFYDLDGRKLTLDEAGDRLWELRPEYPDRKTAPDGTPLLTYDEIVAIVEEEWERQEK